MSTVSYITGDQASIAISGTGAPTQADAFRFQLRYVRPEKNATPYGSTVTRFRNTRPTGRGRIDIMISSAAATPPPLVPSNTVWNVIHTPVSGQTETFDVLCLGRSSGSDNWSADTQVVSYDFVLDSDITLG